MSAAGDSWNYAPRTERFEIMRKLGAGGMGVVYAAYDRERQEDVALKTLQRISADGLYRFKNEFRALADIKHRNLVGLYELICEDNQWFFTMERIHGRDFLEYIEGTDASDTDDPTVAQTGPSLEGEPTDSGGFDAK